MVTVPTNSTSYRSISLPNPCFLALYFLPKCNAKVPTPRRDDRLMHIPNIWKLLKGSSKDISPPNSRRIFTKRRRRHGGRIGSDHNLHHHRELDLEIDNLAAGTPEIKVFMKYKLPEFSEVQRYDLTKIHFDPVFRYCWIARRLFVYQSLNVLILKLFHYFLYILQCSILLSGFS